jgi:hypothetical protein
MNDLVSIDSDRPFLPFAGRKLDAVSGVNYSSREF